MTAEELQVIAEGFAPVVREVVAEAHSQVLSSIAQKDAQISSLIARVAELELRPSQPGPAGQNGKDGSRFVSGPGRPVSPGQPEDVYLDATTGDVYQWR